MKYLISIVWLTCLFIECTSPGRSFAAPPNSPPAVESDPGEPDKELEKVTKTVALRGDDERLRPESQFQRTFGNTLFTFTGSLSLDFNFQDNRDLNSRRNRDRLRVTPELELNGILEFPNGQYIFSEIGIEDEFAFRDGDKPMSTFAVQMKELFFQTPLPLPIPTALRLGRQQFFEPRRWFLDDSLDGIRLLIDPAPWHVSFSLSTAVPGGDEKTQFFDNVFTSRDQLDGLIYAFFDVPPLKQKTRFGFYLLAREDNSPLDEDPIWLGLRILGRPKFKLDLSDDPFLKDLFKPRIKYWFDTALVRGTVKNKTIKGFALDLGASYIARKLPYQPYLTLSYAYGSGDGHTANSTDGNFRQTGFHANTGKFGGVVNFDYYGVLFDPELSNMHIVTAGVGLRPSERTSVDLVYHHYAQSSAATTLRDSRVSENLNGINSNLGDEVDLVVGSRAYKNVRIRWRNGLFFPGPAFDQGDTAFETRLDIQFGF